MGLPALRNDPQQERVAEKPRLRVVKPQTVHRPSRRRGVVLRESVQRVYTSFVLVVVLVALLGMGRVWLSASAAEASIDVASLQGQIKAAQNEGDILEVRKSSLATPSRVQAMASIAMGMTSAGSSTYLDLANVPTVASLKTPRVAAAGTTGSTLSRVLTKAMSMAAGEAQQLLVGDVGLASE